MGLFSKESFSLWRTARKLSVLFCFLLVVVMAVEFDTFLNASNLREVELVWKLSSEGDVAGYNIYYDTDSRYDEGFKTYRNSTTVDEGEYVVHNNTGRFLLASLDSQLTYWVSVTAFDHAGNESDYSNEMTVTPGSGVASADSSGSSGCQTIVNPTHVSKKAPVTWGLSLLLPCLWIWYVRHKVGGQP